MTLNLGVLYLDVQVQDLKDTERAVRPSNHVGH